jgi:hypothetical protein
VKITAESLEGNKRLRAIVRAGVGTDNIDKNAATRLGIVVMNTPAGNTLSTAEHTFALMLALSRSVAPAYQSLIEGRWDRKTVKGTQFADKVLGAALSIGKQDIAAVVDDAAIHLLGNAVVEATVASLEMVDGDAPARGRDGRKTGIGVTQDEQPVGLLALKQGVDPRDDLARLVGETR